MFQVSNISLQVFGKYASDNNFLLILRLPNSVIPSLSKNHYLDLSGYNQFVDEWLRH